ncbi:hypothetical protein ACLB2K_055072 [Fragaria x ananassa]
MYLFRSCFAGPIPITIRVDVVFPTLSSPRHFRDIQNLAPTPLATKKEVLDYHTELGGGPARFALEEFNKIKKTQLQLVRVAGLWMKLQGYRHDPCHCLYVVNMEAVDADGVARVYQARVQLHDSTEGMCLEAFYHCYTDPDSVMDKRHMYTTNRRVKRLYHFLDNFYETMYPEHLLRRKNLKDDGDGVGDHDGDGDYDQ